MTELATTMIVVAIVSTGVGGVGASIVLVSVLRRKSSRHRKWDGVRRRWSRWLASRRFLSRATVSLVAAFRELRRDPSSEGSQSWRYAEAQRARAYWYEAVREHERAEAELEIAHWVDSAGMHLISPRHPASEGFRVAITGSPTEAGALLHRVQEADREAAAFALASIQHELATTNLGFQDPLSRFVLRWIHFMSQLVDNWARR